MDLENYNHLYTVGELLDFIEENKIPRDGKILIQRVEDVYFEKNGWETIKKECSDSPNGETEYFPLWCPVNFDKKNLFLDAHY